VGKGKGEGGACRHFRDIAASFSRQENENVQLSSYYQGISQGELKNLPYHVHLYDFL
jgi:hypothetical protein